MADAHGVDAAYDLPVRPEVPQAHGNLCVAPGVEVHGEEGGHDLSQHRGPRRTGHPHVQDEDENGVQDDVDEGPQELGDHGVDRLARGLEEALEGDLQKDAEGAQTADAHIGCAALHDLRRVRLDEEELPGPQAAYYGEHRRAAKGEEHRVGGGAVSPVEVLLPQAPAQKGVDAHPRTRGDGDHQVLHREGEAHRVEGVFADAGDEKAVYDIIQGRHQHTEHNRRGHGHQQAVHRQDAHLVLSFFFHFDPFQRAAAPSFSRFLQKKRRLQGKQRLWYHDWGFLSTGKWISRDWTYSLF